MSEITRRGVRARASKRPNRLLEWAGVHRFHLLGAAIGLLALITGYVAWTLKDLPDANHLGVLGRTIIVYDRNGKVIEQRNSAGQFYVVLKLNQMGANAPAATLAAEDRNFYHEGAINWLSLLRAAAVDLTSRSYSQGGSTITQQTVKIQLLNPQKSIFRKIQEAILAEGLAHRYSKDQILELYLNRVYYGHGAYGIGAAAKTYFGKDKQVPDLSPAQAAFLAGLVQAPTYYDPQTQFDRARARELYVLDGMVKTGVLTQAKADEGAKEDIKSELKYDTSYRQSRAPHFVDYVVGRLEAQLGSSAISQGGFAIHTSLDLNLQDLGQRAVAEGVASIGRNVNNGDLLAANPKTGEILAWVGSADYYNQAIGGQYNVVLSPRQPGSSFKPYVYEAALKDHRITLATQLNDVPTDFGGGYRPLDWDNSYLGRLSARRALVLSRNIPAVETGKLEGIDNVAQVAHSMGIQTPIRSDLSTAIGASEVTMFEHVQGYQVFANQGHLMPLLAITRVEDAQGNVLYEQRPGQQDGQSDPLSASEAFLITDVLKHYQEQWGLGFNRQMASKSGTTGGAETGVHRDAWMMAYNPDIVVGTWAGNTEASGPGQSISAFGEDVGLTVMNTFVNGLPPSMRNWYQRPSGIVDGHGCPGDQSAAHEIFLAGTQADCPAPSPSPTPTPSPSPSPAQPSPTPIVLPSPSPILPSSPPSPPAAPKPSPS